MTDASCSSCPYSAAKEGALECRAKPPIVFAIPGKLGGLGTVSVFPTVTESHWCGEHPDLVRLGRMRSMPTMAGTEPILIGSNGVAE